MSKSLKQIMDELHQEDPWYMDTYWSIYRFFRWHKVFHPIEMYREVKYFIQRGRRGWSDRDAWSLDYYLTSWMPEALGYIRKHKHGVPIDMYDAKDVNDYGNPSKDGQAAAEARWDLPIGQMISGFEAARRIVDTDYPELQEDIGSKKWIKEYKRLTKRDEKIMNEGMKLFVKHLFDLWD